jgi:hypothetical protein
MTSGIGIIALKPSTFRRPPTSLKVARDIAVRAREAPPLASAREVPTGVQNTMHRVQLCPPRPLHPHSCRISRTHIVQGIHTNPSVGIIIANCTHGLEYDNTLTTEP